MFKFKSIRNEDLILDQKGFKYLYDSYWEKVFAVCYHNTDDAELAKEMTQSIFLSIWESSNTLRFQKSYEQYLVRAAKLKVAEHFRNQAIRKKHLDRVTENFRDAANYTEEDVNYSLLAAELNLLVDQLPRRCQEVFKLSRKEGMTNIAISQKLQVSERSIVFHIIIALAFLI